MRTRVLRPVFVLAVLAQLSASAGAAPVVDQQQSPFQVRVEMTGTGGADEIRHVALPANDLVYDPVRQKIYASVPAYAGALGNTVTTIDPVSGDVGPSVAVGLEPGRLAISDDGQFLYVALDGEGAVRRVDLATFTATRRFTPGFTPSQAFRFPIVGVFAEDLEVLPGPQGAVAVSWCFRHSFGGCLNGVAVYDDGTMRPTVAETGADAGSRLVRTATSGTVFHLQPSSYGTGLAALGVDAGGVRVLQSLPTLLAQTRDIDIAGARLFTTRGQVIDLVSESLIGTLPGLGFAGAHDNASVRADAGRDRVAYLKPADGPPYSPQRTPRLQVYDKRSLTSIGALDVPGVGEALGQLIRWGDDGLAFATSGGRIVLVRAALVTATPRADLSVAVTVSDPPSVSSPGLHLITIRNDGPDDATAVTLSYSYPQVDSAVAVLGGNCTRNALEPLRCDLGTIPAGGRAVVPISVTLTGVADLGGFSATVASAVSDPTASNNVSTSLFSSSDLAGTWRVYGLAPTVDVADPTRPQPAAGTFLRGSITFGADGIVTGLGLVEAAGATVTLDSGPESVVSSFAVSHDGGVTGGVGGSDVTWIAVNATMPGEKDLVVGTATVTSAVHRTIRSPIVVLVRAPDAGTVVAPLTGPWRFHALATPRGTGLPAAWIGGSVAVSGDGTVTGLVEKTATAPFAIGGSLQATADHAVTGTFTTPAGTATIVDARLVSARGLIVGVMTTPWINGDGDDFALFTLTRPAAVADAASERPGLWSVSAVGLASTDGSDGFALAGPVTVDADGTVAGRLDVALTDAHLDLAGGALTLGPDGVVGASLAAVAVVPETTPESGTLSLDATRVAPGGLVFGVATLDVVETGERDVAFVAMVKRGPLESQPLVVLPATVEFGPVPIGTTATRQLTVTNVGTAAVSVIGAAASTPFAVAFSPVTLAPGQGVSVDVTLRPAGAETFSGSVTFTSDAGEVVLDAAGRGVPATWRLAVATAGSGRGTITTIPLSDAITCPGICEATLSRTAAPGSEARLFAVPDTDSVFVGWSGDGCGQGSTQCVPTVGDDVTVIGIFAAKPVTLNVEPSFLDGLPSPGVIVSSPAGIQCPHTCQASYPPGTQVTLVATPPAFSIFMGWSGEGCSGTGTCVVSLTANARVSATFTGTWGLTVSHAGTGTGVVTRDPMGLDCGNGLDCGRYPLGTPVVLTAVAAPGSAFTGWSECPSPSGQTCTVVSYQGGRGVTATFELSRLTLNVRSSGAGSGTVALSPGPFTCAATCTRSFPGGTLVTLVATPAGGSRFVRWAGCASAVDATCTVSGGGKKTVVALFAPGRATTVTVQRTGGGTVSGHPGATIACAGTCTWRYAPGTIVTLTATPATGWSFGAWRGCPSASGTTCTLTATGQRRVSATFVRSP